MSKTVEEWIAKEHPLSETEVSVPAPGGEMFGGINCISTVSRTVSIVGNVG